MKELKMGMRIESEHKKTWNKIQQGKIKTKDDLYKSIATDHIKEDPKYYEKLKRCKL